jgi:glycosyltransferase involved in cell wall biosynthesis
MKVIFIIPFPPVYKNINAISLKEENLADPFQTNAKGERIYFFRQDWGGIIGDNVIKADSSIQWEIWRPDDRADRIYKHVFSDGLTCISFPVSKRNSFYGITKQVLQYSNELENALVNECSSQDKVTVLLPTTVDFSRFLHAKIQELNPHVLYYHFLNSEFLIPQFDFSINPLKLIHRLLINGQKALRLRYIDNLQVLSEELQETVQSKYPAKNVFLARLGIDLSFWQNVVTKDEARNNAGLDIDSFVFLMSQRLVPEYQIDKWLQALSEAKTDKFQCIITGTGERAYVDYLTGLIDKYKMEGKVRLVGFVSNELLRTYITACDCFAMPGKKGGGSTGAIYAMHMNRLVLHTNSGVSYEVLKKFEAGIIVKPDNYEEWPRIIERLIRDKGSLKKVPADYIKDMFSWDKCTAQWLNAVKKV